MSEEESSKWRRLPKPSFSRKDVKKRMRKAETATVRHAHKFVIKRWNNIREVQKHVFIWILTMGVLIASTGFQLMWYENSYKTYAQDVNGTYAEAMLGPINTLNPLFASNAAENSASYLMFSRLFNYDTSGNLNYDLVSSIKINDKNNNYTITIKSDAKWHDGKKLTSEDIIYTVNLMKDPNTRSVDAGWSGVSVKAINDTTIEFSTEKIYAAFEHILTFPILPKHILSKIPNSQLRESNFSNSPIGSGPFKLSFVQKDDLKNGRKVIYMTRNDNYYRAKPKLALFQLHTYSSTDEIIKALDNNEVNSAVGITSSDVNRVNKKQYKIINKPVNAGVYALLNTKSEMLKDINIRKALQLSTNTDLIRNNLTSGTPKLGLPFIAGQLDNNTINDPTFNNKEAVKILEDSGWKLDKNKHRIKDGKELKILVVTVKNIEFERVLEVIAGQWRAVGFNVETQVLDTSDTAKGVVQNVLQPRNFDVLLYQLNIGADPDVYAYWHSSQTNLSGLNFSNYSSIISDDALSSARSRIEPELRNAKYLTFAKQWLDDIPAIGLYQSTVHYVVSKNTQSFNENNVFISQVDRYSDISNWSVGSKKVYKTP